jgi:hypothetical protein
VWGSEFTKKAATQQGVSRSRATLFFIVALAQFFPAPAFLFTRVLSRAAQAAARGGARCVLQVLDRGAQADDCGTAQVLDRGKVAVSSGTAR